MGIAKLFEGYRAAALGVFAALLFAAVGYPVAAGAMGPDAMAYLGMTLPSYAFLMIASMFVFPTLLARMVRVCAASGDTSAAKSAFTDGLLALLIPGTVAGVVIALAGEVFAGLAGLPGGGSAYIGIAPLFLFSMASAAFRGYYLGRGQAWVYGASAAASAFASAVFMPIMAGIGESPAAAAQWANLGISIGELVSLVFMAVLFAVSSGRERRGEPRQSGSNLMDTAVRLWLPGILSVLALWSVFAIMRADALILPGRLASLGASGSARLVSTASVTAVAYPVTLFLAALSAAMSLYGLRPLSAAFRKKDNLQVAERISVGVKTSVYTGMFFSVMTAVLARPICAAILGEAVSAEQLDAAAGVMTFMCPVPLAGSLAVVTAAKLCVCGKAATALINGAMAFGLKFVAGFALGAKGAQGAAFSASVCVAAMCALNVVQLYKRSRARVNPLDIALKPALAALFAGAAMYFLNGLLEKGLGFIGSIIAALICAVVYMAVIVIARSFDGSDYKYMPLGEKLRSMMSKEGIHWE